MFLLLNFRQPRKCEEELESSQQHLMTKVKELIRDTAEFNVTVIFECLLPVVKTKNVGSILYIIWFRSLCSL